MIRFGEWTGTYAGLYFRRVAEIRQHSAAPLGGAFNDPRFPWTTPPWDGVLGAFVSPRWGLVWFDGMLVLAAYLFVRFYRVWNPTFRMLVLASAAHLGVYALFYGRYYEPAGWPGWGDRYLEVPALFLSVYGVFMLFRSWRLQNRLDRAVSVLICAAACIVQLASGVFLPALEEVQLDRGCGDRWVILQRFRNIGALWHGVAPGSDCVPADSRWYWDPYVFPGALARVATRTDGQRYLLWSAWACGVVVVLLLAGRLVLQWRQQAVGCNSTRNCTS